MPEGARGRVQGSTRSHLWQRHAKDWYVEPAWCDERLFQVEKFRGSITDPCCGMGRVVQAARAAGYTADGADVVRRSDWCEYEADFFKASRPYDNIVSNPPYKLAADFVRRALELTERKVALLLPAQWLIADKRAAWLPTTPLRKVLYLTPRPSMPPGEFIAAGGKAGNGKADYAWFIWQQDFDGRPEVGWLRRDA